MITEEFEKKLATFDKKILIKYIVYSNARENKQTVLDHIKNIERELKFKKANKLFEEFRKQENLAIQKYKEYLNLLKQKYQKENITLKDLKIDEIESLKQLRDELNNAEKNIDKALKMM